MTAASGDPAAPTARSSPTSHNEEIPADTFAARLLLARHHAGRLSIEKAAIKCGLNPGNWAHWEDGRLPRDKVEVAQAVSDGLGLSFDWLLLGGPLLSGRGRVTNQPRTNTARYLERPLRAMATRAFRRPASGEAVPPVRRRRPIDRSQPVAGLELPGYPLLLDAA